jgi:hypothetical protein
MTLGGEGFLGFTGDRGVETREHQLGGEGGVEWLDGEVGDPLRRRARQAPGAGGGVGLAGGTVGGRDLGHLEPGMIGEELDESLSDRARGAQDSDGDLRHKRVSLDEGRRREKRTWTASCAK